MKSATFLLLASALTVSTAAALRQGTNPPSPPPFGPSVTAGQTLTTADMTSAAPLIPADIYRNADNSVDHADLATFAWLSFISAVSPAASGSRGVPGGSFASSGAGGDGPLTWETYQHRTELLPCNFADNKPVVTPPQPWGAAPKYVTAQTNPQTNVTTCSTITLPGGGALPYNNLDEANQIGQNSLFYPANPASPNPATDAQVLFEARVNQVESDWAAANYTKLANPPYSSPSGGISLPNGTFEVKAAWRPLSSIPVDQQYRYHTATVLTYGGTDTNPTPQTQTYALVALHLIHKTPNYPAFIFATFEQVDDLNNQATGQPTGVYYVPSYDSVAYATPATTALAASGQTVNNPNINFSTTKPTATPYGGSPVNLPLGATSSFPGAKKVGNLIAIPVNQPVTTVPEVATVNQQALTAMQAIPGFGKNFVWQYYKLAGVQAIPTNDETKRDFYLANIVVESSQPGIQLFRGFPPINGGVLTNKRNQVNVIDGHFNPGSPGYYTSMGGCQGCHGVAQTQDGLDFSFLYFGAGGGGFSPETVGIVPPATLQRRLKAKRYAQ